MSSNLLRQKNTADIHTHTKYGHIPCFICKTKAPWLTWEGEWRPVCRRHFVIIKYDYLSDEETLPSMHPDLLMAYTNYVEEVDRGPKRERDFLKTMDRRNQDRRISSQRPRNPERRVYTRRKHPDYRMEKTNG